jgi:hypothetical protein
MPSTWYLAMSPPANPARIVPGFPRAPGTSATSPSQSRPFSGRFSTCEALTRPASSDFCVSISGDWPVTVTVSATVAIFIV